jgi:uncharacterized membrane protein
MRTRLRNVWQLLNTSFWFVPTLMALAAVGLAFVTIEIDARTDERWRGALSWVWGGGPEGARELMSTIASSMITVAGVVFSITIVSLQLASSQYGPRLLGNFMRDTGNQLVLGTFVATFIYCLLVLRTVRSAEGEVFVPHLSVTVGALLALASLAVLIYFIHHVADAIQAENLTAATARDLRGVIDYLFPEMLGKGATEPDGEPADLPTDSDQNSTVVLAAGSGYVQAIESETLMKAAGSNDLLLRLLHRPGDFIVEGEALARVWPADRCTDETKELIADAFIVGRHQTLTQDAKYSAHQLVEIAVRALSPGINDPFTAIACMDWLGASLRQLAQRRIPSIYRYDSDRRLRIIAPTTTFADLADIAFNQIRQYGHRSVPVMLRALETIARLADNIHRAEDGEALRRHATLIWEDCERGIDNRRDREKLGRLYRRALTALDSRGEERHQPEDSVGSKESDRR